MVLGLAVKIFAGIVFLAAVGRGDELEERVKNLEEENRASMELLTRIAAERDALRDRMRSSGR